MPADEQPSTGSTTSIVLPLLGIATILMIISVALNGVILSEVKKPSLRSSSALESVESTSSMDHGTGSATAPVRKSPLPTEGACLVDVRLQSVDEDNIIGIPMDWKPKNNIFTKVSVECREILLSEYQLFLFLRSQSSLAIFSHTLVACLIIISYPYYEQLPSVADC